jgi:hypothetical protein
MLVKANRAHSLAITARMAWSLMPVVIWRINDAHKVDARETLQSNRTTITQTKKTRNYLSELGEHEV